MQIVNNSTFSVETINELKIFGRYRNNWRGRLVLVREHPTDPTAVISVGVAFDGREILINDEPYISYAHRIETGDWSDYN